MVFVCSFDFSLCLGHFIGLLILCWLLLLLFLLLALLYLNLLLFLDHVFFLEETLKFLLSFFLGFLSLSQLSLQSLFLLNFFLFLFLLHLFLPRQLLLHSLLPFWQRHYVVSKDKCPVELSFCLRIDYYLLVLAVFQDFVLGDHQHEVIFFFLFSWWK